MRIGGRYLLLAGVAFVVFYVWKRQSWLSRKIQPRFPKNADYRRELGYSLATVAFFAVVSSFLLFDEQVRPYTRLMAAPDALGWAYYWGIFPVLLFSTIPISIGPIAGCIYRTGTGRYTGSIISPPIRPHGQPMRFTRGKPWWKSGFCRCLCSPFPCIVRICCCFFCL